MNMMISQYSFNNEKSNGVLSVRWNTKDLINTMPRICDLGFESVVVSSKWRIVPEMNLMLFDLNEAVTMV